MTDWAKLHADWPWVDAARMKVGLVTHRDAPHVPHLTRKSFGPELKELGDFGLWMSWLELGRKGPRPPFDARVPEWAWTVEAEYRKKHAPPPKPPAPPTPAEAVSVWKNPPVLGRGFEVAWEFSAGQYTPAQLADRVARAGATNWSIEAMPAHNEQFFADFVKYGKANGLKNLVWMRADAWQGDVPPSWDAIQQLLASQEWDGVGADIEVFPIYDPDLPQKIAEAFPNLYRTTIVAGMADASYYTDWEKYGWDCKTEAYAAQMGVTAEQIVYGMESDAFWRGFPRNAVPAPKGWAGHGSGPHTVPILEINLEGNPGVQPQLSAVAAWSGTYSHWIAGSLQDADWFAYERWSGRV